MQWSLLKSQHHKHPYDDHKGWVTLEPVPWSSSHVSKWQSNVQPGRPWDSSPSPSTWHNDLEQRPGGFPPHHGSGPGPAQDPGQRPGHGPNSGYHHGQHTNNFNGNGDWPGTAGSSQRPWNDGPPAGPSASPWDRDRPDHRPDSRPGPGPG